MGIEYNTLSQHNITISTPRLLLGLMDAPDPVISLIARRYFVRYPLDHKSVPGLRHNISLELQTEVHEDFTITITSSLYKDI